MFTKDELNNLLVFMNQVQLQGNQSLAHALLVQKLQTQLQPEPEKKKDETTETNSESI